MTITTADLARSAGIAAVEDQTPPELIASSLLMVQALDNGVPFDLVLEHLVDSALAVLLVMPDGEAAKYLKFMTDQLERLELLP